MRFAVYGDMGNDNAQSLSRLQVEAQDGMYDGILHVGKFCPTKNAVCAFQTTCKLLSFVMEDS